MPGTRIEISMNPQTNWKEKAFGLVEGEQALKGRNSGGYST